MHLSGDKPQPATLADERLDLLRSWRVVVKHRWLVIISALATSTAVLAWNLKQPKIYEAQASIIIDPQAPKVLQTAAEVVQLGSSGGFPVSSEYYNTQFRILKSRSLAERVVQKFELYQRPQIVRAPAGVTLNEEQRVSLATSYLQDKIRVNPVRDSRVVSIGVRDPDPKLAAELANLVAEVFSERNLSTKKEVTQEATRFLKKQLQDAHADLDKKDLALHMFRSDNNILSVSLEDRQNMITSSLQEFSKARDDARKSRIDLESRRRGVALLLEGEAIDVPSDTLKNQALDAVRATYLEERRKFIQLEQRYGRNHPELTYTRTRMAAAKADLESEAKAHLRSMDAQIKALKDAEGRYLAEVNRLTEEGIALNRKELTYKQLVRSAENASQVYTTLLKRLNESGLQEQDEANNIRILDKAMVPRTPVEPNMRNVLALALALGLMLPLALAFGVEVLDRSIKSQEDFEATAGVPFLGIVPFIAQTGKDQAGATNLYIVKNPNSTASENCRIIRTNITFSSPDDPLRSFVVTSSNPVEGKTLTAMNLGAVMAQSGHRTLLVDTDMRRPRLHRALGIGNERGVSSVVVGECSIEDAVKSTGLHNLYLLPCGPLPPNPAELLQTEKFAALVKSLLERFDRVIFDSPPVLAVTDAAVLSRAVNGVVFVARAGKTSRDALARARRQLGAVNARIVGGVLNDVSIRSGHYSGYYGYYQKTYHRSGNEDATETT